MSNWDITKPLIIPRRSTMTPSEKGFIFSNHKTMTCQEMADHLHRSKSFVNKFMHKYNLPFKNQSK